MGDAPSFKVTMPQIVPVNSLETCEIFLNKYEDGIKCPQDIPNIQHVMEEYSHEVVCRSLSIMILKKTSPNFINMFMDNRGWMLLLRWLRYYSDPNHSFLLLDILKILQHATASLEKLRLIGGVRSVRTLLKNHSDEDVKSLVQKVTDKWLLELEQFFLDDLNHPEFINSELSDCSSNCSSDYNTKIDKINSKPNTLQDVTYKCGSGIKFDNDNKNIKTKQITKTSKDMVKFYSTTAKKNKPCSKDKYSNSCLKKKRKMADDNEEQNYVLNSIKHSSIKNIKKDEFVNNSEILKISNDSKMCSSSDDNFSTSIKKRAILSPTIGLVTKTKDKAKLNYNKAKASNLISPNVTCSESCDCSSDYKTKIHKIKTKSNTLQSDKCDSSMEFVNDNKKVIKKLNDKVKFNSNTAKKNKQCTKDKNSNSCLNKKRKMANDNEEQNVSNFIKHSSIKNIKKDEFVNNSEILKISNDSKMCRSSDDDFSMCIKKRAILLPTIGPVTKTKNKAKLNYNKAKAYNLTSPDVICSESSDCASDCSSDYKIKIHKIRTKSNTLQCDSSMEFDNDNKKVVKKLNNKVKFNSNTANKNKQCSKDKNRNSCFKKKRKMADDEEQYYVSNSIKHSSIKNKKKYSCRKNSEILKISNNSNMHSSSDDDSILNIEKSVQLTSIVPVPKTKYEGKLHSNNAKEDYLRSLAGIYSDSSDCSSDYKKKINKIKTKSNTLRSERHKYKYSIEFENDNKKVIKKLKDKVKFNSNTAKKNKQCSKDKNSNSCLKKKRKMADDNEEQNYVSNSIKHSSIKNIIKDEFVNNSEILKILSNDSKMCSSSDDDFSMSIKKRAILSPTIGPVAKTKNKAKLNYNKAKAYNLTSPDVICSESIDCASDCSSDYKTKIHKIKTNSNALRYEKHKYKSSIEFENDNKKVIKKQKIKELNDKVKLNSNMVKENKQCSYHKSSSSCLRKIREISDDNVEQNYVLNAIKKDTYTNNSGTLETCHNSEMYSSSIGDPRLNIREKSKLLQSMITVSKHSDYDRVLQKNNYSVIKKNKNVSKEKSKVYIHFRNFRTAGLEVPISPPSSKLTVLSKISAKNAESTSYSNAVESLSLDSTEVKKPICSEGIDVSYKTLDDIELIPAMPLLLQRHQEHSIPVVTFPLTKPQCVSSINHHLSFSTSTTASNHTSFTNSTKKNAEKISEKISTYQINNEKKCSPTTIIQNNTIVKKVTDVESCSLQSPTLQDHSIPGVTYPLNKPHCVLNINHPMSISTSTTDSDHKPYTNNTKTYAEKISEKISTYQINNDKKCSSTKIIQNNTTVNNVTDDKSYSLPSPTLQAHSIPVVTYPLNKPHCVSNINHPMSFSTSTTDSDHKPYTNNTKTYAEKISEKITTYQINNDKKCSSTKIIQNNTTVNKVTDDKSYSLPSPTLQAHSIPMVTYPLIKPQYLSSIHHPLSFVTSITASGHITHINNTNTNAEKISEKISTYQINNNKKCSPTKIIQKNTIVNKVTDDKSYPLPSPILQAHSIPMVTYPLIKPQYFSSIHPPLSFVTSTTASGHIPHTNNTKTNVEKISEKTSTYQINREKKSITTLKNNTTVNKVTGDESNRLPFSTFQVHSKSMVTYPLTKPQYLSFATSTTASDHIPHKNITKINVEKISEKTPTYQIDREIKSTKILTNNTSVRKITDNGSTIDQSANENNSKIKSILKSFRLAEREETSKQKSVLWKQENDLVQVSYFEFDETERVGNMKAETTWMCLNDSMLVDVPIEKKNKENNISRSKSYERSKQHFREKCIPPVFYPTNNMIPDSPAESDRLEDRVPSTKIPERIHETITNNESLLYDYKNKLWPEPLRYQPSPETNNISFFTQKNQQKQFVMDRADNQINRCAPNENKNIDVKLIPLPDDQQSPQIAEEEEQQQSFLLLKQNNDIECRAVACSLALLAI